MFGNDWFVWKQSDSTSFLVVTHNLAQTFKMLFKHQGRNPRSKSRHNLRQSYTGFSKMNVEASVLSYSNLG